VQIGGALGVAVLAGVVLTQRASDLIASGVAPIAAQAAGLRLAFLVGATVALLASLVAAVALDNDKAAETAAAPAEVTA
jgi:hypothetical protein